MIDLVPVGDRLDRSVAWLITNRRYMGGLVVAVSTVYVAFPEHSRVWEGLLAGGAYLWGAGQSESDAHKAKRLQWQRSGNEDRRV